MTARLVVQCDMVAGRSYRDAAAHTIHDPGTFVAQYCWQGNWICPVASVSVGLTDACGDNAHQDLAGGWRRQMQHFHREKLASCVDDNRLDLLSGSAHFSTLLLGTQGIHETSSCIADRDFGGGSVTICLLGECSDRANVARSTHMGKSPSAKTVNSSPIKPAPAPRRV
jgi:hypothetical protein